MTGPAPRKRLYIKTYGCQMNVYDSERMADVLRPLGYGLTDQAEGADLVVLNTCHIREKATEKVYSELGQIRRRFGRAPHSGVPCRSLERRRNGLVRAIGGVDQVSEAGERVIAY